MTSEVESWPFSFPASEDFPSSNERGNVSGRLFVQDKYISGNYVAAAGAYEGLARPGDPGSWQRQCKGYQFWTQADKDGYFFIGNVRRDDYNLYAWMSGFIGDYRHDPIISISSCSVIDMGDLVYPPPRDGLTLWEIGIPDHTSTQVYVPDPNPLHVNRLLSTILTGLGSMVCGIDILTCILGLIWSTQSERKEDGSHHETTRKVKFSLDYVDRRNTYKLRIVLALATLAELQVRVNDPNMKQPLFMSGLIGRDNSIARHGIHRLNWLYNINVLGNLLKEGENTVFLTQPRCNGPFQLGE